MQNKGSTSSRRPLTFDAGDIEKYQGTQYIGLLVCPLQRLTWALAAELIKEFRELGLVPDIDKEAKQWHKKAERLSGTENPRPNVGIVEDSNCH